jgi:hypothetical protein
MTTTDGFVPGLEAAAVCGHLPASETCPSDMHGLFTWGRRKSLVHRKRNVLCIEGRLAEVKLRRLS